MTLKDLLEKGHFPRELPPPFTSAHFANYYINNKHKPIAPHNSSSRGCRFSCPKGGLNRKTVILTNPAHQTPLFECINDDWAEIQTHYHTSSISYNRPSSVSNSSDHGRSIEWTEFKDFRRQCFQESFHHRYELRTDISKYYPSIYTHSIPWALHTKIFAKNNKHNKNLLGNKLDKLVRKTQQDQTIGIPIGPDSSIIIAEIIGTQIDAYLKLIIPDLVGYRYIDDMYFYFDSQAKAEFCLKEIQHIFKDLELQINTDKTSINNLPCGIEDDWVIALRTFVIRTSQITQLNDLYSYFSLAFNFIKNDNSKGILAYVIRRLKDVFVHHKNFPDYESMLYKVIQADGSALPDVLRILLSYSEIVNKSKLKRVIQEIIKHSAPRGYDYEVAWALWYAMSFSIQIDDEITQLLSQLTDAISILLILQLNNYNLISSSALDTSSWIAGISPESLYDDRWILYYEISIKKWLVDDYTYIDKNPFFRMLRDSNVSFFDPSRQIDQINNFNNPKKTIIQKSPNIPTGGY